jgi:hypothetical protein
VRKIKYIGSGYRYWFGMQAVPEEAIKDGWLHGIFQEVDEDGGSNPVAVVESEDGECYSIGVRQIKFVSPPPEEVKK